MTISHTIDVDLPLLQYIFNHNSEVVTLRNIGITKAEADKVTSIILNFNRNITQ